GGRTLLGARVRRLLSLLLVRPVLAVGRFGVLCLGILPLRVRAGRGVGQLPFLGRRGVSVVGGRERVVLRGVRIGGVGALLTAGILTGLRKLREDEPGQFQVVPGVVEEGAGVARGPFAGQARLVVPRRPLQQVRVGRVLVSARLAEGAVAA